MAGAHELREQLRQRVVSGLHTGRLRRGDRLPSLREVSRELGVDHRAVARAYRELESEGLVQIRGRSGIYVAGQERLGGELLQETWRWLAGMLTEAWTRRWTLPGLPEMVRRCTAARRLSCACVESNEDQLTALCDELREDFGLDTYRVWADAEGPAPERLVPQLEGADVVVATAYHAVEAAAAAERLGLPFVRAPLNPHLAETIERRLRSKPLTFVIADRRFEERLGLMYPAHAERMRVVLAERVEEVAALDAWEPVILTRAARKRLGGLGEIPLLYPHSPSVSAECARDLFECIVRLNLEVRVPGGGVGGAWARVGPDRAALKEALRPS